MTFPPHLPADIDGTLRKLLWTEAVNTAIDMNNITVNQSNEKSPHEIISRTDVLPKYTGSLRRFGEIGVIMNKGGQHKSKIINQGRTALMVGYYRLVRA